MSLFIKARDLEISWQNDTRQWKWITTVPGIKSPPVLDCTQQRSEIAQLVAVWWLEIQGKVDSKQLQQKTSYGAYLIFSLSEDPKNLDKVKARVRFQNDIAEGTDHDAFTIYLAKKKNPGEKGVFPQRRNDGWMEVKIGEFYNKLGKDGFVDMKVFETSNDYAKYGLYVAGIELRPLEKDCIF